MHTERMFEERFSALKRTPVRLDLRFFCRITPYRACNVSGDLLYKGQTHRNGDFVKDRISHFPTASYD